MNVMGGVFDHLEKRPGFNTQSGVKSIILALVLGQNLLELRWILRVVVLVLHKSS